MTDAANATFTAGLVTMRSGLLPQTSLAQGVELIREAKKQL